MKKKFMQIGNALLAAIFSGICIAILQPLLYYFHMIEIAPRTMVQKLLFFDVKNPILIYSLYFCIYLILSIFFTFIYYVLLKKARGWLPGALYGVIIWAGLYCLIPFLLTNELAWKMYNSETTVITFCISLLYGIFIGYSISYYYHFLAK